MEGRKIFAYETQLFETNNKKYIDEERIVQFIKNSEKGLRFTWIENYIRTIPESVAKQKILMDNYQIFDNYVILHYDPDAKSFKLTQEQIQEQIRKKRDPILFGVIKGSRKLYFIGDWKDELCDLTFEVLVQRYGEEPTTLSGTI